MESVFGWLGILLRLGLVLGGLRLYALRGHPALREGLREAAGRRTATAGSGLVALLLAYASATVLARGLPEWGRGLAGGDLAAWLGGTLGLLVEIGALLLRVPFGWLDALGTWLAGLGGLVETLAWPAALLLAAALLREVAREALRSRGGGP